MITITDQDLFRFTRQLIELNRTKGSETVVLRTNGTHLERFLSGIGCVVDLIVIDRPGSCTLDNIKLLGTDKILTDYDLRGVIMDIHAHTDCRVLLAQPNNKAYIEYLGVDGVYEE